MLSAETTYFVVFTFDAAMPNKNDFAFKHAANADLPGGEPGWDVANVSLIATTSTGSNWAQTSNFPAKIRVRGTEKANPPACTQRSQETELLCAAMTVGMATVGTFEYFGFNGVLSPTFGALSPASFPYDNGDGENTFSVTAVHYTGTSLQFDYSAGTAPNASRDLGEGNFLLYAGTESYAIDNPPEEQYSFNLANASSWSDGDEILVQLAKTIPLVTGLGLVGATLDEAFEPGATEYTASVPNATARITLAPPKSDPASTVEYFDGGDAALVDADAGTAGFQVDLAEGDNVVKVEGHLRGRPDDADLHADGDPRGDRAGQQHGADESRGLGL